MQSQKKKLKTSKKTQLRVAYPLLDSITDFVHVNYSRVLFESKKAGMNLQEVAFMCGYSSPNVLKKAVEYNTPLTLEYLFSISFRLGVNKEYLAGVTDKRVNISAVRFKIPEDIISRL